MTPETVLTGLLFVSIGVGFAAAILAWRERPEPGATPLVALLAAQSWWAVCIVFRLRAPTVPAKLLWADLAWLGVVSIPLAWLLFALEYTGRDTYVSRGTFAGLAIVPVATVVLAFTTPYHDLLTVHVDTVAGSGVLQVEHGGPWYAVVAGYTYLLGLAGAVAILDLVSSDSLPFRGQAAALLVGVSVPWATNALYLVEALPTAGIDPTPIAFSVSGVAYLGALTQFSLLHTNPAPRKRARQIIFDGMQEGAVVLDTNDYVVDANDYIADALGTPRCDLLGRPGRTVIPEYERLPAEGTLDGYLTIETDTGTRPFDVGVTPVENGRGDTIGRVVTLHDIGRYLRQQQRLEVLNRVLRHNIRTETNVIHGYAEEFGDERAADIIKERALRIDAIGQKGRDAVELFQDARNGERARRLDDLLDTCIAAIYEANPAISIEREYDAADVDAAVSDLLEPVLENLLENAVRHGTHDSPTVRVGVERDETRVHVTITDDGPGINDTELAVLEDGTESALRHGSGLGLWIVKWGTEMMGGDVSFAESDPHGTAVTVSVPILATDDA
ncbi:PAS domain-containing sensor histidine kinase [Halarchaeum grantii]|uniref:histidine kinase n=1 Tax=Halarchaeum grantii TaxID=1193105 RepID=A0A830EV78_9EURY|nr:histidine kinase N-terminal 7TM domain-containing protein [Halarchaeum grantii]GGL33032.1 PAS domain-containing sensor histidine kinase [Halarchaeum grantii]